MGTKLRIGKVASAVGLSVQTIRYYERLGLLPAAEREMSGYRIYRAGTLERLQFIRQAQAAGFRLDEIREILRIKYAGQSPCDCVQNMLQRKLTEADEQLRTLATFRKQVRRALERAHTLPRLPHRASAICPLIENISSVKKKRGEKR